MEKKSVMPARIVGIRINSTGSIPSEAIYTRTFRIYQLCLLRFSSGFQRQKAPFAHDQNVLSLNTAFAVPKAPPKAPQEQSLKVLFKFPLKAALLKSGVWKKRQRCLKASGNLLPVECRVYDDIPNEPRCWGRRSSIQKGGKKEKGKNVMISCMFMHAAELNRRCKCSGAKNWIA